MISLLIAYILVNICSSQSCVEPWCYSNAYMTVCHDEYECGLVNDKTDTSQKCEWLYNPENGVAVKPGMFQSYCDECDNGNQYLCSYDLGFDEVGHSGSGSAYICTGDNDGNEYDTDTSQLQTCHVDCGAEICLRRTDSDTGKAFYKTGRMVSSCPEHHPVNTRQCCDNKNWAYCTCLQRPTVDVSDDVYDDLGQSNGFIDVWYGSCGDSEYHATDDGGVKIINEDGISQWYYAIAAVPYNPNFYITTVKAKPANANDYSECVRQSTDRSSSQSQVFKCTSLSYPITAPVSIEMWTSGYTPDGSNYPYIQEEGLMSLTANEFQLVDLHLDQNGKVYSGFTEDEAGNSAKSTSIAVIILVVIGVIIAIGAIGYIIYKRRQKNKGDVSFSHKDGIENKDGDAVNTAETA